MYAIFIQCSEPFVQVFLCYFFRTLNAFKNILYQFVRFFPFLFICSPSIVSYSHHLFISYIIPNILKCGDDLTLRIGWIKMVYAFVYFVWFAVYLFIKCHNGLRSKCERNRIESKVNDSENIFVCLCLIDSKRKSHFS